MARVRLDKVTKVFENGFVAVKEASLDIENREFMVLVGPSGCGKSTTLRMVAGLEEVSKGRIQIGDRDVTHVPPKDRDIAMVFQNYALYPHMSCFENMAFGLKIRRVPKSEIEAQVREAAGILGIESLLDRKPRELSGGQRQRVAVGRAIVRNPKVFLFDEPLSNLDAKLRVQMRAEISRLHNRLDATMVYVTHDQVEAMTMGDRIVVMLDGVVQQIDAPLELYHQPVNRFVAGFIGSPPMNFLSGRVVRQDGIRFVGEGVDLRLPDTVGERVPEGIVDLGLRPESVTLGAPGEGFAAEVDVVEPMGSEIFLHLRVGESSLTARVPPENELHPGDTVHLVPDPEKLYFFDAVTGTAMA